MSAKFKRGRLLVHPAFQFGLVARMGLYLLLFAVAVVHVNFLFAALVHLVAVPAAGVAKGFADLYLEFLGRQKPLLVTLFAVSPVLLYDLFRFSNRIAGPLYRCRKVMEEMARGRPVPEFRPRKHDLMQDFFETFDRLIQQWNARLEAENAARPESAAPPAGEPTEAGKAPSLSEV